MAANPAYLIIYHDIQATVSSLLVQVRQTAQQTGVADLRVVEDHLFIVGTALQLVQDDIAAEAERLTQLGETLAEDMRKCHELIERVRRRERELDELRLTDAITRNFAPEQISVDEAAGVTLVRGSPRAKASALDNVLAFPDALSRAARRILSEPPETGGAA